MSGIVGVVPAAGRGTRAHPYTAGLPKCMLDIAGEPNLARILAIFRDQLHVKDVVVVTGAFGSAIRDHFGDGSRFGVKLSYVANDQVERGLGFSLLLTRRLVGEHACVILGDECYLDTNHHELLPGLRADVIATCALTEPDAPERVRRNYAAWVEGDRVTRLVEKPKGPLDRALLGLGTFVFRRDFYDHLERALDGTAPADPVSVLGRLCEQGHTVAPFHLRGSYVNVNDRDQLNLASCMLRAHRFERKRLALVVLARSSSTDAARTLRAFRDTGRFSQAVLALPPAAPAPTAEELDDVVLVRAPSDGLGDLYRAGLDAAEGDILVSVYGDRSFSSRDLPKFLEYLKDADLVTGTRTTRQLIDQGTNMRGAVRLAHVGLAKALELLWWDYEPRLTDVGCAFRALWSSTYRLIRPRLRERGPGFFVEMLLETLACRKRVIEIPINFHLPRPGMREPEQTARTALHLLELIVKRRLVSP